MRGKGLSTIAAMSIAASAPAAHAATLIVNPSGQLTGATGVDVGGTLYNVSFLEGTCSGLFSGCDEVGDFAFQTEADARLADEALDNHVFLDSPLGNFDTNYALTFGCESNYDMTCAAIIPYSLEGTTQFIGRMRVNYSQEYDGRGTITAGRSSYDSGARPGHVYAVFARTQVGAVPEPATWAMMLLGFAATGVALRRRRKERVSFAF